MLNEDSDDDLLIPSNIGLKGMKLIKSTPSTPKMIPFEKTLKKIEEYVPAIDEGFDYVNFPSLTPDQ